MIAAKNAKVGKVDWKTVKLGEISVDGGHYGIGAPAVEYDERLPTYLRITDIRDDGSICKEGLKSVDNEDAEEYYLKPNDLVIARTGASTGRNYFYDGRDGDFVYAGFLIKFSIDENKIWPPYVKYWFKGDEYRSWLNNHTDGSTRANINAVTLAECPIRVPKSLPTQRKIAAVLGALDDKIENNRKICANLEAQAQALFKSWFVDFEPFGGKMPKDWKMGKLGEVADLIAGFAFKAQCFGKSYDDKVVKITDIDENGISIGGLSGVDISGIEKDRILKYKVFTGDYVLAMTGSIGKFGRVLEGEAYINQRVLVVRNKSSIMKNLLYYALKQKRFTQHLITHIDSHSVQANISANSIGEYELIVPSKEMQNRYESKVDVFVKKIITLNSESRSLAELRDALLPKLMSGELDIDDVEV